MNTYFVESVIEKNFSVTHIPDFCLNNPNSNFFKAFSGDSIK